MNLITMSPITLSWEPCGAYDTDHECEVASCLRCGWPGHEHGAAPDRAGVGVVVLLDRRPVELLRAS